jgi:ankyrin repeat protein
MPQMTMSMMSMASASKRVLAALLVACSATAVEAATDLRLVDAVRRQDRAAIRTFLDQKVDVRAAQPDGATALHWAAHWNDLDTAASLLRAGADVNRANDFGVTPLSIACSNASAPMVERLLASGANPNRALESGESPLMTASRTGSAAAVAALVKAGAQVNAKEPIRGQTALMWAVANRRDEVARVLIENGADIQARSTVVRRAYQTGSRYVAYDDVRFVVEVEEGGFTPLLFAARSGDLASAVLLLGAGAKVDDPAPSGTTPLVVAAHSGHGDLAALFLEKGADANAAGAGYTALHAAILVGDVPLVRTLLARKADPNAALTRGTPVRRYSQDFAFSADLIGATPFWLAARYGDVEIMRALAGAGADTRFIMKDGSNALVAAVAASSGFGSGDRRERYLTPVQIAERVVSEEERITLETAKLTIELGSDVNHANQAGDTALHLASAQGLATVVQFLVDNGATLDIKNKRGLTPLGLAMQRQRGEGGVVVNEERKATTADLLRKLGASQ